MNLTKDQFESLKCNTNYVLIKPDLSAPERIKINDEVTLHIDTSYEKEKHAATTGTVVKACERTFFDKNADNMKSLRFDSEIEVLPGDKVFYHYLSVGKAQKDTRIFKYEDEYYMFIKYDALFCAKRGDEVIPLNGWLLMEPMPKEEIKTSLYIPDTAKSGDHEKFARVKYIGNPCQGYHDEKNVYDAHVEVNIDDIIIFGAQSDIPLQYEFHASLEGRKKLFRMQRKDLLGIISPAIFEEN